MSRAVLMGGVLAVVLLAIQIVGHVGIELDDAPFVARFADPDGPLEAIMARSDGQAFAQVASDPLLDAPEQFGREPVGSSELAYRAQRPLASYLVWALALGQVGAVPVATLVLTLVGCVALVALVARLARAADPALGLVRYAPAVLLVPGIFASFRWLMPGALAAALAIGGAVLWHSPPGRRGAATTLGALACLSAAVLTRETMLVVPAALLVGDLWRHRRLRPRALLLATPAGFYAAWWAVVRLLLDLAITHTGQADIRRDRPLRGLVDAMGEWGLTEPEWYLFVGTVVLVAAALRRRAGPELITVIALGLLIASTMSVWVWRDWTDWSRAIVPVHIAAIAAIAWPTDAEPSDRRATRRQAGTNRSSNSISSSSATRSAGSRA